MSKEKEFKELDSRKKGGKYLIEKTLHEVRRDGRCGFGEIVHFL